MATRNYWLDLFTLKSWEEFWTAGGTVSGFREGQWNRAKKITKGDYLLCYLTGASRFIGVLEVIGTAYRDTKPIWSDDEFPCPLKVKSVAALSPETAGAGEGTNRQTFVSAGWRHITSVDWTLPRLADEMETRRRRSRRASGARCQGDASRAGDRSGATHLALLDFINAEEIARTSD